MDLLIILTCGFYLLSTLGYTAYLFAQKNYLFRTALYLIGCGFICHTLAIGGVYFQSGHIPVRNLYETLSVAAWALSGMFLISTSRFNLKILGSFAAPLVTLIMLVATQLPREPGQVKTIFTSFWLGFHVLAIFIGEAAFALACGIGILYLLQERAIKTKRRGFFFSRLPSLERLDTAGYGCLIFGFTFMTLGLVTGLIYAKSVWGRFWTWDPKEVWSGITWLIYAALLHERLVVGWRGRKSAIMAIIGFAVILFTFLGVNFLFQGHHGQFTRI